MSASSPSRLLWLDFLGIAVLFAAIALMQVRIDAQTKTVAHEKDELLLSSGAVLKNLSLGYDPLLADIYWTRTVQYYGARLATHGATFELLRPLLDITTTLDPKLVPVYRFGSIFLSEPPPIGAGRTDFAVELVKKGIVANPDRWVLSTDLGFLYYWRLKDYPHATAAYLDASRVPGAPVWTKLMAARISAQGDSIETSRMIWSEIHDSTRDPYIRKSALDQYRILGAQLDEKNLDESARQYHDRFGRYPASTKELRDAGLLQGIPVDPAGFPFGFTADGKARLDPHSTFQIPAPFKPLSAKQ